MVRTGRLAALGIDVFPQEPWPGMDAVVDMPNLMFLPPAAGYHKGLARLVREGICRAVRAHADGRSIEHAV